MRKLAFILFLICAGTWFGGFLIFNYKINHYVVDEETKTDAIIALTGGRHRISKAIKLLNQGLGDKLFISGVSKDISLEQIEHRNDVEVLRKQKVQIGNDAKDTIGNAIETNEWIKKNNIKSIRLVTSNYHIPRSMLEFSYQNKDIKILVHPVYSDKVQKKWWKNWGSFRLIFTEYNKFLYVYLTKQFM